MNLSKFNHAYKRDGIIGFLNIFLGKLGIKFRFQTSIQKRVKYLEKQLKNFTKNLVQSGPYKNLEISSDVNWSDQDFSSKILGVYEEEVQKKLIEWNVENFVNLGGAEGYHGLGQLLTKTKSRLFVFEQDNISQKILKKNSEINNLQEKVTILGRAETNFLDQIKEFNIDLKNTCFLFVIEGGEYQLLNKSVLGELNKSKLIIELHLDEISQNKLLDDLNLFFNIEILTTTKRDLSKFKFLENYHDIDRWLMVSENRPTMMRWVVCEPK